jgi:hypothetical protein
MDVTSQDLSLGLALLCAAAVFAFGLWLEREWLFGDGVSEEDMINEEWLDKVQRRVKAREGRPRDWRSR